MCWIFTVFCVGDISRFVHCLKNDVSLQLFTCSHQLLTFISLSHWNCPLYFAVCILGYSLDSIWLSFATWRFKFIHFKLVYYISFTPMNINNQVTCEGLLLKWFHRSNCSTKRSNFLWTRKKLYASLRSKRIV